MELVDRYLHAVRFWLPAAQRDDIIAELGDDLRSEIAHRASEIGREPDEVEIAAILKRRGRPEAVAGHYLEPRSLIGPSLLPIYWFVLKLVVLWIQVPVFAFIVGPIAVSRSANPAAAVAQTVWTLLGTAICATGIITVIFAIAERHPRVLDSWNRRWLPRTPGVKFGVRIEAIPRSIALSELMSGILCATAWLYLICRRPELNVGGLLITPAPVWHVIEIPILLVFLNAIGLGWTSLKWPSRVRLRSRLRLAIDAYALVLIGILLAAENWAELKPAGLSPTNLAESAKWLNISIQLGLLVVATVLIVESVQEIVRLRRQRH